MYQDMHTTELKFKHKFVPSYMFGRQIATCATSRTVPGSIPGGVSGDFFRGTPDRTMCPEVDSAHESEYQGFLLG